MFREKKKAWERPNPGMYTGICWCVCDYGDQPVVYQGKTSMKHKIRIGIELHGEGSMMSEGENVGKHFSVFAYDTLSLGSQSNMRPRLEGWTGKPIPSDEQGDYFDFKTLIGMPCLIQVIHKENTQNPGNPYVNIGAITPLMSGAEIPVMTNQPLYFMLDESTQADFDMLPEWAQNKINLDGYQLPQAAAMKVPDFDDENSDIPFD